MRIIILFICFSVGVAEARMYQWVEPDSGTTQLSGKPPAWYRSENGGPRVFVFDKGRLIDDTAVAVSDEVRQRMRQQAFVMAEEDEQRAREKLLKSRELKQRYEKDDAEDHADLVGTEPEEELPELVTDGGFEQDQLEEQAEDTVTIEQSIEDMKKIISDWEASQTETARQALDQ